MNGRKDQHDNGSSGRTEPTLGDLDHVDTQASSSKPGASKHDASKSGATKPGASKHGTSKPRADWEEGLPKFTADPEYRPKAPVHEERRRPRRRGWLIPL